MSKVIKILITDDHATMRSGLKHSLAHGFDSVEFGEASNGDEALKKIKAEEWDLVILDVKMPGKDGFEVIKEIKNNHPNNRILLMSMYNENLFAVKAIESGALAYLPKTTNSEQLLQTVKTLLNRRKYISSEAN